MSRPARRRALPRVGLALAAAATAVVLPGGPASAGPVEDARARAAALATRVSALQDQAEAATERYDGLAASLQQAVAARISAATVADHARVDAQRRLGSSGGSVRALYETGGGLGLVSQVLGSGNPQQLAEGLRSAQGIVADAHQRGQEAEAALAQADARAADLASATRRQTALEVSATRAQAAVAALLDQQQTALAAADADVRRLLAQVQARRAAAQQAAFARALAAAEAAAQAPAGSPLVGVPAATTAASPAGAAALAAAQSLSGHPYIWGGTGPVGYDCSGMTDAAYAATGVALPRTAAQQYLSGPHPGLDQLQPGDLLFWASDPRDPATIHHVALYAGGGLMVSANHTGDVVRLQTVFAGGFLGATRPRA